jgi:hypothetical protein
MNIRTTVIYGIFIIALPFIGMAQTFNGGGLDDGTNWSPNQTPPSFTGSIGVDGEFDTSVTGRTWTVTQSAGTITQDVNGTAVDFDGGSWTMSGGNLNLGAYDFTNFALTLNSGATFNQQATSGQNSLIKAGSSITVSTGASYVGTGIVNDEVQFDGGVFTVDGGSSSGMSIRGNSGTFVLNGGSATFSRINQFGATINLGSSGTLTSISDTRYNGWNMDWDVGSGATVEIEDADLAETMWNAGTLLYNSQNNSALGGGGLTWAQVTTAGGLDGTYGFNYDDSGTNGVLTLVAIPEPSSIALFGLAGLALYMMRRRK